MQMSAVGYGASAAALFLFFGGLATKTDLLEMRTEMNELKTEVRELNKKNEFAFAILSAMYVVSG